MPTQAGEAREVRIHGHERRIVFDCKSREVGIRRESRSDCRIEAEPAVDRPVGRTGMDEADFTLVKPHIHDVERARHRNGKRDKVGIGRDPQKRKDGLERNADFHNTRQSDLKPARRCNKLWRPLIVGVKKKIGVRNDQRRFGPSSRSSRSSTLPDVHSGGSPMSQGFTRNGSRGFNSDRSKRLTTEVNGSPER
jgi:hypothetical protein